MTMLSRTLLCALAVGGVLLVVFSFRPDWAEAAGLDLWRVPSHEAWLESERQRGDDLDAQLEAVKRRYNARQEVVDDVIAGRLGLLDAAARFRDVTPGPNETVPYLRTAFAGGNDDERFCRWVIVRVDATLLSRSPAEADRAKARLEKELQDCLRRDGRVALPR